MTRKRFVKLCMAFKFDRNFANDMANDTQMVGASYQRAFYAALDLRAQFFIDNPGGRLVVVHGTLVNAYVIFT